MEKKFTSRGYPTKLLTTARQSPPKNRTSGARIPFVNTYHPYSKRVQATIHRHWNILSRSYPNTPEFQQPFYLVSVAPPTSGIGGIHKRAHFHPPTIKRAIPKSQFQKVKRIVTKEDIKNERLDEMEKKFTSRGYPTQLLTTARESPPKNRTSDVRIPFVNTYHPYSKRVQATIHRHWNILSRSYPNTAEFQQPFLPCFCRPTNLRHRLVRADVVLSTRIPRQVFLWTKKNGKFPCLNCLQCNIFKDATRYSTLKRDNESLSKATIRVNPHMST
ncbi:unnamed protein product [Ranitomeya imitator]|uniref:Helix-turn-helix domain-containing protein n=1 Tax=Ranitomeya imitator TaxID=111125 RepID=A0ABN9LRL2_9NEOB|nr:unnamed protein product [Ranitomeya imitator]